MDKSTSLFNLTGKVVPASVPGGANPGPNHLQKHGAISTSDFTYVMRFEIGRAHV